MLLEVGKAGAARVKRMVYPAGFRWSVDMKPVVGTEWCMHAHVGFLVHGEIHIEYPDGCVIEHRAPQIIAIEPGHDGWVVGKEPVVMIEFDSNVRPPAAWACRTAIGTADAPTRQHCRFGDL